jgi:hypothetical protein
MLQPSVFNLNSCVENKEMTIMLFNPFSFRNIFYGVVLGIVVVIVWLFHGEIWAYLQTQAPEIKEIIRTAVYDRRNIPDDVMPEPALDGPEQPRPSAVMEPEETKSPAPVIEVLEQGPSASTILYPFRAFDSAGTARRFVESIRKSAGVELQIERQAHRYVVLIPALDETERERKAALIREKAGVGQ